MPLTPGTTLGPYAVTAKIGEGGMGEVYRARDTKLDRDVALKVLPQAFTDDPDRLARFEREAKVLASLNHPNIGHIYGLEEAEGQKALVLELVEGPTLADRIAQGPIPVDEALPIAKQIAEALEAAHEQGVIHRDLKPANVKVRPDGMVKVLDFGLAKAFEPEGGSVSASMSPTISLTAAATQMGMVIGTAAYMAPEQAKGLTVDKRADIWAYGAVLFEMLTGKKLFEATDVSEMLASVLIKDPDISSIGSHVPDHIRSVVRQCLVKDPKERLRDIGDVRLAMRGVFETISAPSDPGVVSTLAVWQRPIPVGLTVTLVTGLAVWSLTRPAPPPAGLVSRFLIPLTADQTFSFLGRRSAAISPDGSQIVYVADRSLWLRPVDQLQATVVPGTEGEARGPFFSADGQSIGFWASGQLKKVAVSGGVPVTLTDGMANPSGASWGADDMILYGQPEGIMQVPGASGTPELLIPADENEVFHGPQMLPGGEWVLMTVLAGQASWDEAQIVAQSVTTGERTVLIEGGRDGRYLSTGHLVYGLNGVLFAVLFDVDSREVTGGPVPLVEGVRAAIGTGSAAGGASQFSVSASGSLVYRPGSEGGDFLTLVWVDRDGNGERVPAPPRGYDHPRVSPDGTRVAVDITDGDNTDVWIWDLERETLTQFTFDEGVDNYPLWTLDSERVVFQSRRDGGGLFWKAADGTGQVEQLKDGAARPGGWTADGRLVFDQAGEGNRDIGMLTMEGERTVEMLLDIEANEVNPTLSPDGRWLAYASTETGQTLIYVKPFPNISDDPWRVSPEFGINPLWSPDGRELFYRTNSEVGLRVVQTETEPTFSSRTPELLFRLGAYEVAGGFSRHFDIAPDGDRFIMMASGTADQTSDDEPFNGLIFVENWFQELTERVPIRVSR